MKPNTLFLRLEGPLQSWGDHQSEFVMRRTCEAPTKSGVAGILCAAKGLDREAATETLKQIANLSMAVRIDRPGVRWWDFHTVGANMKMRTAEGGIKDGPLVSRREYLCNASFLVVLQGDEDLISDFEQALAKPRWQLYLGRKCCIPSAPILESPAEYHHTLMEALKARPFYWCEEFGIEEPPSQLDCILEWKPDTEGSEIPYDAEIWYDLAISFKPPVHAPRIVIRRKIETGAAGVPMVKKRALKLSDRLQTPHADYGHPEFKRIREKRLEKDHYLCVFCKSPATTVQHVTYRRAGGREQAQDLRSLCRLCHDAVTMIEYGLSMGLDRINPEDPRWRDAIMSKRQEIIRFRSLQLRKRWMQREGGDQNVPFPPAH